MSLTIKNWKKYLPKALIGLLCLLVLFFFVKVAVWEFNYYRDKEGSERDVVATAVENPSVDETIVTVDALASYTVPASYPRYLSIEKLGIKSRVLQVTTTATGELDTPRSIFDVGWYTGSAKPGESGTAVIDGHNGGPTMTGVFKNLPSLVAGDIITIERGDGAIITYSVVENKTVPLVEANSYMTTAFTTPESGKNSLTLITCTGEWSQAQQTYLSRQFVRAVQTN